ncbi:MAG: helix-turn-helix transcriptional regulator [Planctomycetes bacterium]|nr:helix-turn-helix transcriptional regulator [Planctomycetota bacterium]
MIWSPGSEHLYGNERSAWSHSWIAFDGTSARSLIAGSAVPVDDVVPCGIGIAQDHFTAILREMVEPARPDPVIIRNLLDNWLRTTARAMSEPVPGRPVPAAFLAVRRRFEERCDEPIDLTSIARQLRLSRWHLCRVYRRWFGASPMEDLQRFRMQRAGLLARDPDISVAEIAKRSGYPDPFHFSKQFKKHYGASPTRFRHTLWGEPVRVRAV